MSEPTNPPGWVNWPTNLPTCASNWTEKDDDPRIHTEMDVGRAKTRRRGTGIVRRVQVTMDIAGPGQGSLNEVKNFRTFFETPGNGSSATVGNSAPHSGGTDGGYHYFKFTSPVDGLDHYYRFAKDGAPEIINKGPLAWTVSMTWEEYD